MITHNASSTVVLSREAAAPRGTLEQYMALERSFRPPGLLSYFTSLFDLYFYFQILSLKYCTLCAAQIVARRHADGSINWRCPCVRSSVGAPCGAPFRSFIDCLDRLLASLPLPPAATAQPQATSDASNTSANAPSSGSAPTSPAALAVPSSSSSDATAPPTPMPSFCTEERVRVFDCMHRHDRYYKTLLDDLQRDDDEAQMPSK